MKYKIIKNNILTNEYQSHINFESIQERNDWFNENFENVLNDLENWKSKSFNSKNGINRTIALDNLANDENYLITYEKESFQFYFIDSRDSDNGKVFNCNVELDIFSTFPNLISDFKNIKLMKGQLKDKKQLLGFDFGEYDKKYKSINKIEKATNLGEKSKKLSNNVWMGAIIQTRESSDEGIDKEWFSKTYKGKTYDYPYRIAFAPFDSILVRDSSYNYGEWNINSLIKWIFDNSFDNNNVVKVFITNYVPFSNETFFTETYEGDRYLYVASSDLENGYFTENDEGGNFGLFENSFIYEIKKIDIEKVREYNIYRIEIDGDSIEDYLSGINKYDLVWENNFKIPLDFSYAYKNKITGKYEIAIECVGNLSPEYRETWKYRNGDYLDLMDGSKIFSYDKTLILPQDNLNILKSESPVAYKKQFFKIFANPFVLMKPISAIGQTIAVGVNRLELKKQYENFDGSGDIYEDFFLNEIRGLGIVEYAFISPFRDSLVKEIKYMGVDIPNGLILDSYGSIMLPKYNYLVLDFSISSYTGTLQKEVIDKFKEIMESGIFLYNDKDSYGDIDSQNWLEIK